MDVRSPSVLTATSTGQASNAGGVAVGASDTSVITLDLGLCVVGQLVMAMFTLAGVKGGVAGNVNHAMRQNGGTGQFRFGQSLTNVAKYVDSLAAGGQYGGTLTAIGRVTSAGTITLEGYAGSSGSDLTVNAGNGILSIIKINR